MRFGAIALMAVLLAFAAPVSGVASEPSPGSDAGATMPLSHELWLSGPFGRLPGGSVALPAAALPSTTALDTFTRSAPLSLDAGSETLEVEQITVRAIPVGRPDEVDEILSSGEMAFKGPSTAGTALVVVELIAADQSRTERAWLVEVPDRDAPADGLIDIPAPEMLVEASSGAVAGAPGDGCHIDLCVEIGAPAPLDMIPELKVSRTESLEARLSDGSAMVAWEGSLEPLLGNPGSRATAQGAITDDATTALRLEGLEPPTTGAWLLTLTVVFDRERGWMTTRYRLMVD